LWHDSFSHFVINFSNTLQLYTLFLGEMGADDVGGILSDIGEHLVTSGDKEQQIFIQFKI